MSETLGIIGAGHLGKQIANYAISDSHFSDIVFFDDFNKNSLTEENYRILGKTDTIFKSYKEGEFDKLIIGIGYKHLDYRKSFFEKFYNKIPFATIIHTSCFIAQDAIVEEGSILYPGCVVEPNTVIKKNTVLNISCAIAHDSVVGKHSFLSPKVAIAGFVNVGNQCILGINSIIIDGVSLAPKVQLGAGTVVINHIKKSGLYVGNPHRFIR